MEKTKLLCTFSNKMNIDETICEIANYREYLVDDKILVLENLEDTDELFCIYNIDSALSKRLPNTILIHRKKKYNTLYTINSLNKLITILNGEEDNDFQLNWENYRNTLLLLQNNNLNTIKTKLKTIVIEKKWKKYV